jgi:hypothetical protein
MTSVGSTTAVASSSGEWVFPEAWPHCLAASSERSSCDQLPHRPGSGTGCLIGEIAVDHGVLAGRFLPVVDLLPIRHRKKRYAQILSICRRHHPYWRWSGRVVGFDEFHGLKEDCAVLKRIRQRKGCLLRVSWLPIFTPRLLCFLWKG